MEILNKSLLTVNCKVNDELTFNTKGDLGHLYLTVKAQIQRKSETLVPSCEE